jgi:hypothetical protein
MSEMAKSYGASAHCAHHIFDANLEGRAAHLVFGRALGNLSPIRPAMRSRPWQASGAASRSSGTKQVREYVDRASGPVDQPASQRGFESAAPLRYIDQRTFDPPFMPAWHHKCSSDSFGDFFVAFGASSYVSNPLRPVIRDMTFLRLE